MSREADIVGGLDEHALAQAMLSVDVMPPRERSELLELIEELQEATRRRQASSDFMHFVKNMWPAFIAGTHHSIIAKAFNKIVEGEGRRIIINMPPRHTKSEFASIHLPAFYLGKYPDRKIIQATHTSELAVGFGRKVRGMVDGESFQSIFSGIGLSADSKAAGRWATGQGGEYFAVGVGGAIAGKGADLLIIDDPIDEQTALSGEYNPEVYDRIYEWYTLARQRLQPGGSIVIVMCMTGDTPVLMADGIEKSLRDVRPGDEVATYEDGRITTSRINNWRSNGIDDIFTIQTQSGRMLRANARHPFLVNDVGEEKWIRLRDLKPGMALVSTRDVTGHHEQKPNPDSVARVRQANPTTRKTLMRLIAQWAITASGRARSVLAASPLAPRGYALNVIGGNTLPHHSLLSKTGHGASSTAMESPWSSMTQWLRSATTGVMSVAIPLLVKIPERTGVGSCVLTTATTPEKYGASCATTATSPSDTAKTPRPSRGPLSTCDVTLDIITSIVSSGREEVFDVEVDRTENFIANGVVSHNTRWSKRDLTGRLMKDMVERHGADQWELIELPAILPSGKPTWPEYWSEKELAVTKASIPLSRWNSQYQQTPTSDESSLLKRGDWRRWEHPDPPSFVATLISWDTAFEKTQRANYSACTEWGVFLNDDNETGKPVHNIMLTNAFRGKWHFPELKKIAKKQYFDKEPDMFIIEAKAAGAPLIQEMRASGIPVQSFTPTRGNDKIVRVNAITDLFRSGMVWAPHSRWAEEVIEECADFPAGTDDDYVDTVSMAMARFRKGGFVSVPLDMVEDDEAPVRRRVYY